MGSSTATAATIRKLWSCGRPQFGRLRQRRASGIDQFVSAARTSGDCSPAWVLLPAARLRRPGPEHSSARIERFLQLAAARQFRLPALNAAQTSISCAARRCATGASRWCSLRQENAAPSDACSPVADFRTSNFCRRPRTQRSRRPSHSDGYPAKSPRVAGRTQRRKDQNTAITSSTRCIPFLGRTENGDNQATRVPAS